VSEHSGPPNGVERRRRKRTFLHSLNKAVEGFIHVVRHERNMRVHFVFAFLILLAAVFLGVPRVDWLILCVATCLVLMAEMINTAIEEMLNLLHPKYSPTVGLVKDISAGMVLVAAANAFILGFFIFSKYWGMPFDFMVTRLRHSAPYVMFISVLVAVFLVVYGKAHFKKGTPFRGGVVSGHSAVAFSLWTVLVFSQENLFVTGVGFLLALLVAQSRLKSKIHSFWEVVAGALVGVTVTTLCFKLFM
jgi:diacylglycerol kinase (ATP)